MGYTVVTAKVDPETKKEAQKTAQELGMPLSVVIKAFLKQFIKTKTVEFSAREERPNELLARTIKQAEKDLRDGKASPVFDNAKDAIAWLHRGE